MLCYICRCKVHFSRSTLFTTDMVFLSPAVHFWDPLECFWVLSREKKASWTTPPNISIQFRRQCFQKYVWCWAFPYFTWVPLATPSVWASTPLGDLQLQGRAGPWQGSCLWVSERRKEPLKTQNIYLQFQADFQRSTYKESWVVEGGWGKAQYKFRHPSLPRIGWRVEELIMPFIFCAFFLDIWGLFKGGTVPPRFWYFLSVQ